jgi:hypothetical protein
VGVFQLCAVGGGDSRFGGKFHPCVAGLVGVFQLCAVGGGDSFFGGKFHPCVADFVRMLFQLSEGFI